MHYQLYFKQIPICRFYDDYGSEYISISFNELPAMSKMLMRKLFADDTNLFCRSYNVNLKKPVKTINVYARVQSNKLSLNIDKTNYVLPVTKKALMFAMVLPYTSRWKNSRVASDLRSENWTSVQWPNLTAWTIKGDNTTHVYPNPQHSLLYR